MTTINKLTAVDVLQSSDQLPLYDSSNGDARKASIAVVQTYMQDNLTFQATVDFETQYKSIGVTGWSIDVTDAGDGANIHLIIHSAAAGFVTGTIVLPALAGLVDKQEILITVDDAVASSTLTITGNGATVEAYGLPTSIPHAASYVISTFRLKYHAALQTWYRVG